MPLVALGTGGLLAVVLALAWTIYRPRLAVERILQPSRVQRGGRALGVLTVTNAGRLPSVAATAREPYGDDVLEVVLPTLAPGATKVLNYRLPTDQRGVYSVGPLELTRSDPLGLVRRGQPHGQVETFHVHPVVHRLAGLPAGRRRDLEGPTRDSAPDGMVTFHALREYVIGDDVRHIHWRHTARTGTVMVREYVDTSQPRVAVVLDVRPSRYDDPERFEHAVEFAASVASFAALQGFPVELATSAGSSIGGVGRHADPSDYLDFLAGAALSEDGSLADLVPTLAGRSRGQSLTVVTGTSDAGDRGLVGSMRRRFELVSMVTFVPDDLPEIGVPGVRTLRASTAQEAATRWTKGPVT